MAEDYKYRNTIPNSTFKLQLARGEIDGASPVNRFGRNADVDIAAAEDVWGGGGDYTGFPAETETLEIFSSDAADTAAGTGARTVKISGLLSATGAELPDITVSLSGVTPVSLGAVVYHRCSKAIVLTAGSGEVNAGTLTIRHTTTTTNIFAVMPIGNNQTNVMAFTVPFGKTLYIHHVLILMALSGAATSADVAILSRPTGGVFNAERNPEITNTQGYKLGDDDIIVLEALTDCKVRVNAVTADDSSISAEMSGCMIAD